MKQGLAGLALALAFGVLPGAALAQFGWCNKSDANARLAFGWLDNRGYVSQGWSELAPGGCETIFYELEVPAEIYWRTAEADFTGDGYAFCIGDDDFFIEGDDNCEGRGYRTADFRIEQTVPHLSNYYMNLGDSGEVIALDMPVIDLSRPFTPRTAPPPAGGDRRFESGLAEGANGPIFQLDGIFQGCETDDGRYYCAFHAEGWKFFAYADEPTPAAMLRDLSGVAIGTPLTVSGDVVSEGDISAVVALREVIAHADDPFGDLRAAIQGDWVSSDDPLYRMTVVGSEAHESYDGAPQGVRFLRIEATCDASAGAGPVLLATTVPEGETTCFLVEPSAPDRLILSVAGQGGFVSFERPR